VKIKWKVSSVPTGAYSSFQKRHWPTAYFVDETDDGTIAARISCPDEYVPANIKAGNHVPLTLHIADHGIFPWTWRKAKGEFKTLQEAKERLTIILAKNPGLLPKEKSDEQISAT